MTLLRRYGAFSPLLRPGPIIRTCSDPKEGELCLTPKAHGALSGREGAGDLQSPSQCKRSGSLDYRSLIHRRRQPRVPWRPGPLKWVSSERDLGCQLLRHREDGTRSQVFSERVYIERIDDD